MCETARVETYEFRIGDRPFRLPKLCISCLEKEHARVAAEKAAEEAEQARYRNEQLWKRWYEICPPLYREEFDINRVPRALYERAMAWEYGPRGLLLRGETGLGKTRIIYQLVRRLMREGYSVGVIDGISFGHECAKRFGEPGKGEAWIRELSEVDVLFFDEFGKGKMTERYEAELSGLIERRMAFYKPMLITMNLNRTGLLQLLSEDRGEPMVRRLLQSCYCIGFKDGNIVES